MKIEINSNNGWESLTLDAINYKDCYIVKVVFSGKSYDKRKDLDISELINDHQFEIQQVIVEKTQLINLAELIDEWRKSFKPFKWEIETPDFYLNLNVSEREDLITSLYKPALTFIYDARLFKVERAIIIDSTSINMSYPSSPSM